jgi:hypothetical protein
MMVLILGLEVLIKVLLNEVESDQRFFEPGRTHAAGINEAYDDYLEKFLKKCGGGDSNGGAIFWCMGTQSISKFGTY